MRAMVGLRRMPNPTIFVASRGRNLSKHKNTTNITVSYFDVYIDTMENRMETTIKGLGFRASGTSTKLP